MHRQQLVQELKELVIDECDKDVAAASLDAAAPLIGSESPLQLDSLDALQISLAVRQRYGTVIAGGNFGRKALASIDALADTVLAGSAPGTGTP